MKRKYLLFVLPVLLVVLLLVIYMLLSPRVRLESDVVGSVVYNYGGTSFEEPLSHEQLAAVIEIVDGKKLPSQNITGIPSCYFTENVAIILDGRSFLLACDTCAMLQDSETKRYITISESECQTLHNIFACHGGTFPCL